MLDRELFETLANSGSWFVFWISCQCGEEYYIELNDEGELAYSSDQQCVEHDDEAEYNSTEEKLAAWAHLITESELIVGRHSSRNGNIQFNTMTRNSPYKTSDKFRKAHLYIKVCGHASGSGDCTASCTQSDRLRSCIRCSYNQDTKTTEMFKGVHPLEESALLCTACLSRTLLFCENNQSHYGIISDMWSGKTLRTSEEAPNTGRASWTPNYCGVCTTELIVSGTWKRFPSCGWCGYKIEEENIVDLSLYEDRMTSALRGNLTSRRGESGEQAGICTWCFTGLCQTCVGCGKLGTNSEFSGRHRSTVARAVNTRAFVSERDVLAALSSPALSGATLCNDCVGNRYVRQYSYKPAPRFHPLTAKDGLYMGLELETCFVNGVDPVDWVYDNGMSFDTDFWYIKHDSSLVNGVEFVTHPFTPEWGLENFPFDLWESMQPVIHVSHRSAGSHIHVSKDAFTNLHLYKWLMFHWRCSNFVQLIGRRPSTLAPEVAALRLDRNKKLTASELKAYNELNDKSGYLTTPADKQKFAYLLAGKKITDTVGRGFGLSTSPPCTMELRYPAGASSPQLIRMNIEWVRFLYDFTSQLRVKDIKAGVLDNTDFVVGELFAQEDHFPTLAAFVRHSIPTPTRLPSTADRESR